MQLQSRNTNLFQRIQELSVAALWMSVWSSHDTLWDKAWTGPDTHSQSTQQISTWKFPQMSIRQHEFLQSCLACPANFENVLWSAVVKNNQMSSKEVKMSTGAEKTFLHSLVNTCVLRFSVPKAISAFWVERFVFGKLSKLSAGAENYQMSFTLNVDECYLVMSLYNNMDWSNTHLHTLLRH